MNLNDFGGIGGIKNKANSIEQMLSQYGINKNNFMGNIPKLQQILQKKGITEDKIKSAISYIKMGYKGAKFFGQVPKGYENLDVDKAENEVLRLLHIDNPNSSPAASYDQRNTYEYKQSGISYSRRADKFPD
jgi:pimeloyl-CoA synthetase